MNVENFSSPAARTSLAAQSNDFCPNRFFVPAIERFAERSPSVPCSLLFPAFQGYHSYGVVTFRVSLICERVSHLIIIGCYKSCDIRIIETLSHRMVSRPNASTSLVTSVNASMALTKELPKFPNITNKVKRTRGNLFSLEF